MISTINLSCYCLAAMIMITTFSPFFKLRMSGFGPRHGAQTRQAMVAAAQSSHESHLSDFKHGLLFFGVLKA